ncbi:LutC/YkgG family protein [Poriferisphaera sp. WC338]|uniref:LutC/YkgG family protein n=1 Tax=Poriferisphaera sp. WC338 TaxID=3425129 RepID=UPI003D8167A5
MANQQTILGESRDAFFNRVRTSLERSDDTTQTLPPEEDAPVVDESLVRLAAPDDDLAQRFTQGATAVGMKLTTTAGPDFWTVLKTILTKHQAKKVVLNADELGKDFEIKGMLRGMGIDVFEPAGEANFDGQYDAQCGITNVAAALAETGTLVIESNPTQSRGSSLVPETHIALVKQSDILPDMIDYLARFKNTPSADQPSSKCFITGPSKTADIEGVLITGVHGPAAVEIILIKDI